MQNNLFKKDICMKKENFMKKANRLTLDELMEFLTTWLKQKI